MMAWLLGGELGSTGTLEWASPQWAILLSVAAALVAWVLLIPGERSMRDRLGEAVFAMLALAVLVVALARPTWIEEEGRQERGRTAVLIDASRSMGVLENGQPRYTQVQPILDALEAEEVDLYHFGADLYVGPPAAYDQTNTDLEGALDSLSERVAGEALSAVVVITDGLDRGLLRKRASREEGALPPALPGPLTIYQVGSAGEVNDVAVRTVDAGGFAFKLEEFKIRARLEGLGYVGKTVPVSLERDGSPVSVRRATFDDAGMADVEFSVRPDDVGRFTYEVSVPVYDEDAIPSNNRAAVVVRVVRDRIRVLQVAGVPSWDVKMLRRFLKGDPSVDLVSFFILRTNSDLDTDYADNELSLIEFPTDKLFNEELWRFDLVIFQNFDYRPYFGYAANRMLDNIRRYVEDEGHALVMTGGDRSFDLGEYSGTPLESILPVSLGLIGQQADESPFLPVLTDSGGRHPITRLSPNPEENELWWSRLHPADGANLVKGLAPGASALLAHPTRKTSDGKAMPVLAVKEAGKGRTMALTVDSSWRWSFSEAAEGRGNQAYLRFWKNAFRWLMAEPAVNRVTVETPKENYAVGDVVRVVTRVRNVDFDSQPDAKVQVRINRIGQSVDLEGITDATGEVVLEYLAEHAGPHRVRTQVSHSGGLVGSAETVFAVSTRDPELDEANPDEMFLRWLAKRVDGQYYGPGQTSAPLLDPDAGRTVLERREVSLATAPLFALIIALFGGIAWVIRRRSGLR